MFTRFVSMSIVPKPIFPTFHFPLSQPGHHFKPSFYGGRPLPTIVPQGHSVKIQAFQGSPSARIFVSTPGPLGLGLMRTTYVLCISGSIESKHQQQPTAAHQTGKLLVDGHVAKQFKTSPSQLWTNIILDKHRKPNLANGIVFQTKLPWHRESILLGSQLAAGSPFTETISSPSKTPATWRNGVVVQSKVISDVKCHGWLDLMGNIPWNYQPPFWAIADGKLLVILGWHLFRVHVCFAGDAFMLMVCSSNNIPKQCNTFGFTGKSLG